MASALDSPDDLARLRAVRRAGVGGDAGLVEKLVDLALHDDTEFLDRHLRSGVSDGERHALEAALSRGAPARPDAAPDRPG